MAYRVSHRPDGGRERRRVYDSFNEARACQRFDELVEQLADGELDGDVYLDLNGLPLRHVNERWASEEVAPPPAREIAA